MDIASVHDARVTIESIQVRRNSSACQLRLLPSSRRIRVHRAPHERNHGISRRDVEWLVQLPDGPAVSKGLNVPAVCSTGSLATSEYGTVLDVGTHLYETGKLRACCTQSAGPPCSCPMELLALGIPCTIICDTILGSLALFQTQGILAVAVGADRIVQNGDTANKMRGFDTLEHTTLPCRSTSSIPFAVIAPVSAVDIVIPDGSLSQYIEQRPAVEVTLARGAVYPRRGTAEVEQAVVQITPDGLDDENVYNPSFVTPARIIAAVITEKGAVHLVGGDFDIPRELQKEQAWMHRAANHML
ncbi:nagb/rpia/CoA transferase-like protein [Auricularia subglabra TFB-10046 SS5]|nr:nagb/rpia/CoA transferase-like protein [Auricularia subglabra TFB-10046 SS5]